MKKLLFVALLSGACMFTFKAMNASSGHKPFTVPNDAATCGQLNYTTPLSVTISDTTPRDTTTHRQHKPATKNKTQKQQQPRRRTDSLPGRDSMRP